MIRAVPFERTRRRVLAGAAAAGVTLGGAKAAPQLSTSVPDEVTAWIRGRAAPLSREGASIGSGEARLLHRLADRARVIAMGEPGHGWREPLTRRNSYIQHLVTHGLVAGVALETGFAEARRVDDWIQGKPGDPGDIAHRYMTHMFGDLRENLALILCLRDWNASHPDRRIRFFGVDLSTIQTFGQGARGYGVVLKDVIAFLEATVFDRSSSVRARLAPFADRFTEKDYPAYAPQDRTALRHGLAEACELFRSERAAMIAASSPAAYAYARREAEDARQLQDVFAAWTDDPADHVALGRLIGMRDAAMAGHLLWALAQLRPTERIFLHQANAHVAASPMIDDFTRDLVRPPTPTGEHLRKALGAKYQVIGVASRFGLPLDSASGGEIDRAFAQAGEGACLLDLTAPGRSAWWARELSMLQGGGRVARTRPAAAFDALVYFPELSPLDPLRPLKP